MGVDPRQQFREMSCCEGEVAVTVIAGNSKCLRL